VHPSHRDLIAASRPLAATSTTHGLYYLITGIWPLISIRTFQAVTGPKADLWLVKAAGLLIGVVGVVLTAAGLQRRMTPEIPVLAAGTAASLAGIDITYAGRGRISRIYLLDAAAQAALMVAWLIAYTKRRRT
jgi:voltage-gated potassium channel Kch